MPKPFANTTAFNGTFLDTYLIAMQAGTTTGDTGLNEMRKITLGQLRAYVRQGFGNMMNFRGAYDDALPSDPQINDYFYASDDFTVSSVTYEQYHFYEYNGTAWFDISGVLSQFCTLAQATSVAQQQINNLALLQSQLEHTLTNSAAKVPASDAVYAALSGLATETEIQAILALIPAQASAQNQLADQAFTNSSISTNTATFRGTFNLVSDLSLTISATEAQIGTALASAVTGEDNNDYAFVQVPTSDATPTEIAHIDRYKYNGTSWILEYTLNNSGFTAVQWAAINSGITSTLITGYNAHLQDTDVHVTTNDKMVWNSSVLNGDVYNGLDRTTAGKVLDARQGAALKGMVNGIQGTVDEYQPTGHSYAKGDPCIQNNKVYLAKDAITAPAGPFDVTKWDESSLATLMAGVNANADAITSLFSLIWTNPNATSDFAPQDIILDLTAYKAVVIMVGEYKGESRHQISSAVVPIGQSTRIVCHYVDSSDIMRNYTCRDFYVFTNKITVTRSYNNVDGAANNGNSIPLFIYGIK